AEGRAGAGAGGARGPVGGGLREQGTAGPVEVAGEGVEHVDEPAGQGAVRDGAAADAGVDGGGGGGGELPGEGADGVRVDVAGRRDRLGREVPQGPGDVVHPLDVRGETAEVGQVLLEEDGHHRGEQQRVRAGPDGEVPVGEAGGAGPVRVDDREGAAARPERLEAAGE